MDDSRNNARILGHIMRWAGLPLYGVCPFDALREHLLPCRAARRLPERAEAIILTLFPYKVRGKNESALSRYAQAPDYHPIAQAALMRACERLRAHFPSYAFEPFCDDSPIPEVSAAAWAGLGAIGQNGLLIHPVYGSWVFIGEIATNLPLTVREHPVSGCEGCGVCAAACPSHCLPGGDRTMCLSRLTQRRRLNAAEEEAVRRAGSAWGCDLCQECCPHNMDVPTTPIEEFSYGFLPDYDENAKNRAYFWRGPEVVRRNLALQGRDGASGIRNPASGERETDLSPGP